MISSEIQHFLSLAEESHEVAGKLIEMGHARFSAAQSYYTRAPPPEYRCDQTTAMLVPLVATAG